MKKTLGIKGAEPFHFKIVNYNVLAQAMMTEQSYNFQQHNPDHLEWEYRAKCIQEEIDHIGDPEIICLQVILIILIYVRLLHITIYFVCLNPENPVSSI